MTNFLGVIFGFISDIISTWLSLFLGPLQKPDMFWLLIPIYLGWVFTEFFQEKKSATAGNAISNGLIALWAGFDWLRTMITAWGNKAIEINSLFYSKLGIAAFIFAYGIYVMFIGIKVKKNILLLGRIRVVTYFIVMLTPLFYGVANISWMTVLSIILVFPFFYFFVEFIDWITPDPKALNDEGDKVQEEPPKAPTQPYRYNYYQNLRSYPQVKR